LSLKREIVGAIGIILKNGIKLSRKFKTAQVQPPYQVQKKTLNRLLRRAQNTVFGREYAFTNILRSPEPVHAFQENVPIHNYESILRWWRMCLQGEPNVTWPGLVDRFALSSGTSEGSSKFIPVTGSMIKAIQRTSIRQIISIAKNDPPKGFLNSDIMMLGGSTNLDYNGFYFAGDLSGITTQKLPFWFMPFYKPGKGIARTKDWQEKLEMITREAHKWNIGAIVGVPAWLQLVIERVIDYNKVENIHEIWPNLSIFVHGGVHFEPYRKSFEALLGRPIHYWETYLASEGFIAYQSRPDVRGMQMELKSPIFYEFIPFNSNNFDIDGDLKPNPEVITIKDVKEKTEYAIVLSTCAGTWRYLIGDVIRFSDMDHLEIEITGRTRHYLSIVGEHLSVENMNQAMAMLSDEMNIKIKEFTVAGIKWDNRFGHHWFISIEDIVDKNIIAEKLDYYLKEVNDDYRVERNHALNKIMLDIVPADAFLEWLKTKGKSGAQVKFPRVLKNEQYSDWISFLKAKQLLSL
jgi:hypothetical protein